MPQRRNTRPINPAPKAEWVIVAAFAMCAAFWVALAWLLLTL
jgi:hypothetical protein